MVENTLRKRTKLLVSCLMVVRNGTSFSIKAGHVPPPSNLTHLVEATLVAVRTRLAGPRLCGTHPHAQARRCLGCHDRVVVCDAGCDAAHRANGSCLGADVGATYNPPVAP